MLHETLVRKDLIYLNSTNHRHIVFVTDNQVEETGGFPRAHQTHFSPYSIKAKEYTPPQQKCQTVC